MAIEYGLIGEHLGHSFSPEIHGMLADYPYELISIPRDEIDAFLQLRAFKGVNVTIPYKQIAYEACDLLTDAARAIGCVNTLMVRPDGSLYGDNTDYAGLRYLANRIGIDFSGCKVLILGSGGTHLTATAVARDAGVREIITVSRNGLVNYETIYQHADAEILINTTPVGMYPNNGQSLVDLHRFPRLRGVIDVIYNPLRTRLMLDAEQLGIPCGSGLPMLVSQAKYAAEQFAGHPIEEAAVERIHTALCSRLTNLVLIGMPGSGKTSVGQGLASLLNRPFVDLDAVIEQKAGKTIPTIFAEEGESAFRALEIEAAREIGKQTGLVIATGGGAILRQENVDALRQNGVLIQLDRPLETLPLDGRPLSTSPERLAAMAAERAPFYEASRDALILNDGSLSAAIQSAKEAFDEILSSQRA